MNFDIPKKVQILGEDIHTDQLKYHDRPVRVSRQFTFDSAHHLHQYEGKCQSLHGHTYKLQVIMIGRTDERGISIDFGDMKSIVNERIIGQLDHRYLNEALPPMNTTAENMVVWIYEQLVDGLREKGFSPRILLDEVILWETPTSYASVTRELMEEGGL